MLLIYGNAMVLIDSRFWQKKNQRLRDVGLQIAHVSRKGMVDFTREITVLFMLALLVKNLSHVIFVSRALKSAKELGDRRRQATTDGTTMTGMAMAPSSY